MSFRWRIRGSFTTTAPMHVGSGANTEHSSIIVQNKAPCDVQNKAPCDVAAVVMDYQGHPCIPGTALKGVLRAWAEQFFPDESAAILRIFGHRNVTAPDAESGWAEFTTAFIRALTQADREQFEKRVPYWQPDRCTGIFSNVCISRKTGAAQANKLFYQEFVPEGVSFEVEIAATRLTDEEITLLLAVLEHGASHPTHAYQFGANGADGWGRVAWSLDSVNQGSPSQEPGPAPGAVGFDCCNTRWQPKASNTPAPAAAPAHVSAELTLSFLGPFLVNDASRAKATDTKQGKGKAAVSAKVNDASRAKTIDTADAEKADHTNFTPLRRGTGDVWLPSSSFRGALRERTEFLLRSLDKNATGDPNGPSTNGPIERIFGQTSQAARLKIEEFVQVGECVTRRQDFVAIDRFTGGAADGAKFDATYADRPTLKTRLVLDLDGLELERQDVALLALSLRDVCQGRVSFGFGAGKGYGEANGVFTSFACSGAKAEWCVPSSAASGRPDADVVAWLNQSLALLPMSLPQPLPRPPSGSTSTKTVVPDSLRTGTLAVKKTKDGKFEYTLGYKHQATNKDRSLKLPAEAIASSLLKQPTEGAEVQFLVESSKPVRVRRAGEQWETPRAIAPVNAGGFIHPYYFLALADRSRFPATLADESPIGHERLQPDRYTGTIRVRLTTKTPLLICDDEPLSENDCGHKTYAMRTDTGLPDGNPLVMPSSVRGMLRSAYEAVTNSRFGVFPSRPEKGHTRRLGFRMMAGEGLSLVPVRIEAGMARLMLGENPELPYYEAGRSRWVVPSGHLHAAWAERYEADVGVAPWALKINGQLPVHGEEAWCWLEKIQHCNPVFYFWAVREAATDEANLPAVAPPAIDDSEKYRSMHVSLKTKGYFFVSNQNIKNKHDERFFFGPADLLPIEAAVKSRYLDLIQDYQSIHVQEIEERRRDGQSPDKYLGSEPGETAWSRHVYLEEAKKLGDGTLCYAHVEEARGIRRVKALYPVMISRKLYDRSPLDLLLNSLRPATTIKGLSPADRVFGWVRQDPAPDDPDPAYRGQLRFGQVTCTTDGAVETFDEPWGLAILGQPKPQQGRFYLGQQNGSAQDTDRGKADAGYGGSNRIRGPKVYPHHRNFTEESWSSDDQSKQNRSITGWVKPETAFEFDLHVENLARIELGALIWLLSLPAEHFLRMGLGKPLGFGSVQAEIIPEKTRIADGSAWAATLTAWDCHPPVSCDLNTMKSEFESAINTANPTLLQSFLRAAEGFPGLPVHYPRLRIQQAGSGEHYKWFVENERTERLPLPDLLADDPSLPLL